MNKIILTIGASSSGKSTWVKDFVKLNPNYVELNRDEVRFDLFCDGLRDWTKYKFNKKNEGIVTEHIDEMAKDSVNSGANIVVSDTNLSPKIREKWKDFAKSNDYIYEEKLFPCKWEELVKRNAQRFGGLSEPLLWSQYKRYMQQYGKVGGHKIEPYQNDRRLDYTVICDIDGTVADMKGIRKPFDWDEVDKDNPRYEIIATLDGLIMHTGHVTFLSGRDGCCYEDTLKWIEENITWGWPETIEWVLYMRESGDSRKDDVVKYELYKNHVKHEYNVSAVLDDRRQMIRFWSLLDMPNIIDVGNYNEEF